MNLEAVTIPVLTEIPQMAAPVADDGSTKSVPPRTRPYSGGVGHEANFIARDVR